VVRGRDIERIMDLLRRKAVGNELIHRIDMPLDQEDSVMDALDQPSLRLPLEGGIRFPLRPRQPS
jgi:hypothetical protein